MGKGSCCVHMMQINKNWRKNGDTWFSWPTNDVSHIVGDE